MTRRFPLLLAAALLGLPLRAADSADTGEARLREALRAATLQVRAAREWPSTPGKVVISNSELRDV